MIHYFNVALAEMFGVNISILLQNFYLWISKNAANDENYHDGRYWTWNSVRAFQVLFPYWSERQISEYLKKMEDLDLIVKGNFNEDPCDRTCWYALTDKAITILQSRGMDFTISWNDARVKTYNNLDTYDISLHSTILKHNKDKEIDNKMIDDNDDNKDKVIKEKIKEEPLPSPTSSSSPPKKLFSQPSKTKHRVATDSRSYINSWTSNKEIQEKIMQYLEYVKKNSSGYSIERAKAIVDEIKRIVKKKDGTHDDSYVLRYLEILLAKGWRFPYVVAEMPSPDYEKSDKPKAVADMTADEKKKFEEELSDETF